MYFEGYNGQGCKHRGCMLGGKMVEVVKQFKYLGLEFDKHFNLCNMASARLTQGKQVYGMLVSKLAKLGFHEKRAKVILFYCYI